MFTTHAPADLVLGTARLGTLAAADADRVLRAALTGSIAWIDAASESTGCEQKIASNLLGMKGVRISTTLTPHDDSDTGTVRRMLIDSIRRSCTRLRTDRLDVFLLDSARHLTSHAGVLWQTVKKLRDQGVLYDLGVCVETPEQALTALADPDIRHIQIAFTPFDRRWRTSGVEQALLDHPHLTIHARAARHTGRLNTMRVNALARELGRESAIDLCLAYIRGQSWIDGVIVDVDDLQELTLSRALFRRPVLTSDEIMAVDRTLASVPRLYRIA